MKIVRFNRLLEDKELRKWLSINRLILRHKYADGSIVVKGGSSKNWNEDSLVKSVEEDNTAKISAELTPWGITRLKETSTTNTSTTSVNVDVFVIDTGVLTNHPDLRIVESRSFCRRETTPNDRNGHGTAVAGVIGAISNNMYVKGVAPGCRIHNYKALDRNGSGSVSDIIRAVDAVTSWKNRNRTLPAVLNLSLGFNTGSKTYNSLDQAVLRCINAGVVVCVAGGNSGVDASTFSPAHVDEVLTVGAYDINNVLASWSNYGSQIDIQAPGVNVLTLINQLGYLAYISGTSFACPHVAGCAALYLANNRNATPSQVDSALKTLAINTNDTFIDTIGRNNTTNESVVSVGL